MTVINNESNPELERLSSGDSEMARRMRAFDWANSDLGAPGIWPQNLRFAMSICLTSRFPIFIWWGSTLATLYNDAYIPFLGKFKHPVVLSRPAEEVWQEIWPTIGPMIEMVLTTGNSSWSEDLHMFFDRDIPKEEVYVTFSYSPILGENNKVDGIFCACTETTQICVGNRRLDTLRKLGVKAAEVQTVVKAYRAGIDVIGKNPYDIPFASIYLLDEDREKAQRVASAGLPDGGWHPPPMVLLAEEDHFSPWPFATVFRTKHAEEIADLSILGLKYSEEPWPGSAHMALMLPIRAAGSDNLAGFLFVGVNPRLPLDAAYRAFFDLVAGHIATAIADARAFEEERKRAEALAELDRAKTAFFSNVSHEFRTPLTLMLGPLEDEMRENPKAYPRLEIAHRNSLRLLKLVNTLLDFSRIEAGRIQAVYEPTDLAAYTVELASVFRAAIEKAGLRLVTECPSLPEAVYVDREMWEKIVLNLLSNAFKFTFEGEIKVGLHWSGKLAELTVADTGVGIPEAELPRIFERFHRIRGTRSRTHEGTGIGLALVQELVKLHGGEIKAQSTEGHGTLFTIFIPTGSAHLPKEQIGATRTLASTAMGATPFVEEALRWLPEIGEETNRWVNKEAIEPLAPISPAHVPVCQQARILLADDNADMREYLRRLLSRYYEVIGVADGEAALAAAREHHPDLVLTDVMMPRLDGFGLLQQLRSDPQTKTMPIILLSARAGEESRVEGLKQGADDYLIKPFSARELLARVNTHLELARLRKQAEKKLRQGKEELEIRVRERTVDLDKANQALQAEILERKRIEEALRRNEQNLAEELDAAQRLQQVSTQLIQAHNTQALYEQILDTVVAILHADFASIQILFPERGTNGELLLLGYRGFNAQTAEFWKWVSPISRSSCGECLRTGQRVIIQDIEKCNFKIGSDDLGIFRQNGIRAIQTTPLISRSGALLGVFSTHWREVHQITVLELRTLDVLARQAADLIDHTRAEEKQLASERELLKVTLDSLGEGVVAIDDEARILFINETAANLIGCNQDKAIGQSVAKVFYVFDDATSEPVDIRIPQKQERNLMFAGELCEIPIALTSSPIKTADGQNIGTVTVFQDITESLKTQQELSKAEKLESLGILAGGIAHDFNNSLAAILSNVQLALMRMQQNRDSRKYLENTIEATRRASELTKQLLTFSKGGAPVRKDASLTDLIRDTAEFALRGARVKAEYAIPDNLWPASIDEGQISQVIHNLVINAQQAMPRGGVISIGAENYISKTEFRFNPGRYIKITVRDQGVGIAKENLSKIFDPFFTTKEEGNGLGLATSYSIIRRHDGYLEVESQEGQGTAFDIYLPALQTQIGRINTSQELAASGTGYKILLMDDDEKILNAVGEMLRQYGYQAVTATDGAPAIEAYQAAKLSGEPFDAVIMDLTVPGGMGGQETVAILRDFDPKIKAVISSGYANDPIIADYERFGFMGVVSKPYKIDELNEVLLKVINPDQLSLGLKY